jgi:HEAT repeat protein
VRRLLRALPGLAVIASAPLAGAQAAPVFAVAPAGAGQRALAVGFDSSGALRTNLCGAGKCTLGQGAVVDVPAGYLARAAKSKLTVVPIGAKRRAILVTLPAATPDKAWQAVYAAPVGAGGVVTVFAGETGYVRGEWGERAGAMVQVSEPRPDGSRTVLVGEQREDLTLCGRPTILAPQLLSPKDLKLRPARVQRLPPAERDAATVLSATPVSGPSSGLPMLRPTGASSAVGDPRALADGNPETVWSENRGGDGRGELVIMAAPHELPISGFEMVVRPEKAEVPDGVAPRSFFLVSDKQLYQVQLEQDAWQHPGARYQVVLPAPIRTGCVALVLDTAYAAKKTSRVTLAELSARTEVDAQSIDGLVGALAGGGTRATTAASALTLVGDKGFVAVAKAFASLDEGGRRVALEVMDHAPCGQSASVYVAALLGPFAQQRVHARARLPRCAKDAEQAIMRALDRDPRRLQQLSLALAEIAPAAAVGALLPRLRNARVRERQAIRVALGRAAASPRALKALRAALGDTALSPNASLELLRALGPRVSEHASHAAVALERVSSGTSDFRLRYLRLEPAGRLAEKNPRARALVSQALTADKSGHVRMRAAEVVENPKLFQQELARALSDSEVRVREAAANALAAQGGQFASTQLVSRMQIDPWPIVRAAAATALSHHGPNAAVDAALGEAVGDDSRHVRGPVLTALGKRRALSQAEKVRERLTADDEAPDVRARAAEALGLMCDRGAVEVLTRSLHKLADPMLPAEERGVSTMALGALSRIRPPDIADRLRPLRKKTAPHTARAAADATMRAAGTCGRARVR